MAQTSYPLNQSYGVSAPMMPGTTTPASHPPPIAPASNAKYEPPTLRPMPANGLMARPGVSAPYGSASIMIPNRVVYNGTPPPRVVGSQGRRGILPCTTGQPVVPAAGAKYNVVQTKDADGKYPCPHCAKSYLHAKHLKRHLLRHTGDRPYMCMLCRDAFSRSDVLKRHFQKCSVRRGNPTGLNHLSRPQAQINNRAQAERTGGLDNEKVMNHINGLNNITSDSTVYLLGATLVSRGMNDKAGDGNHGFHFASEQDPNDTAPDMGTPQPYGLMFLTP